MTSGRGEDRVLAEEVQLELHALTEEALEVDAVPSHLLSIAAGRVIHDRLMCDGSPDPRGRGSRGSVEQDCFDSTFVLQAAGSESVLPSELPRMLPLNQPRTRSERSRRPGARTVFTIV